MGSINLIQLDAFNDFSDFASSLAEQRKNTLFVDQVVYNFEERQAILRLIRDHITNNVVKVIQSSV